MSQPPKTQKYKKNKKIKMPLCPTFRSFIGIREKRTEILTELDRRELDRREKARIYNRDERHQKSEMHKKRELEDRKQYSEALYFDV